MRWSSSLSVAAVLACATAGAGASDRGTGPPGDRGTTAVQDGQLPPAGFGTLRQDGVGIRLQNAQLAVRVLPLDEQVTRLLATDAYRSLRDMKASRATDIAAAARTAGFDSVAAFMVTFFGLQPQARFDPDGLRITNLNVSYRPIGVVPITPRWSENLLDQRQQQAAIYLFDPSLQILRPMTVSYGTMASDAWSDVLRTLNTERARVLARAGSQPGQP